MREQRFRARIYQPTHVAAKVFHKGRREEDEEGEGKSSDNNDC